MDLKHLTFIGERSPGVDCATAQEELVNGLRFAAAFKLDSPVRVGETSVLDLMRRIYYEAHRTRLCWLCADGSLSPRTIDTEIELEPFSKVWVVLDGADKPISQEAYEAAISEIESTGASQ